MGDPLPLLRRVTSRFESAPIGTRGRYTAYRGENQVIHPLLHPAIAGQLAEQRSKEMASEARSQRISAGLSNPNKVERFFIKRREGKVTWIETVMVQRSA